jgi:hypothetical protein
MDYIPSKSVVSSNKAEYSEQSPNKVFLTIHRRPQTSYNSKAGKHIRREIEIQQLLSHFMLISSAACLAALCSSFLVVSMAQSLSSRPGAGHRS